MTNTYSTSPAFPTTPLVGQEIIFRGQPRKIVSSLLGPIPKGFDKKYSHAIIFTFSDEEVEEYRFNYRTNAHETVTMVVR